MNYLKTWIKPFNPSFSFLNNASESDSKSKAGTKKGTTYI